MKVTATPQAKPNRQYPYIGISENGRIVLFVKPCEGLCIRSTALDHRVGCYSEQWMEHQFSLFEGSVTLEN